nr:energy transducer TonB [Hymenobacter nitidus]
MTRQLEQEYGTTLFSRARHKADSLDHTGRWNRLAEFPGGTEAQVRFLYSHIDWQRAPAVPGKHARVYVSFTIDSTGQVRKPFVQRGLDPAHDQEALRVVQQMPHWTPRYRRGRAYAERWTLPIVFSAKMHRAYAR